MIYDLDTRTPRPDGGVESPRLRARRFDWLVTAFILGAIVLVGLSFRAMKLADWDGGQFLHPDERFVTYTVSNLQLPHSVREYFDSASSPLNPRNYDWSKMFVYGTLPTTITRLAAAIANRPEATDLLVVGRSLSVFFDLVACIALFFLGRRLYGRGIGLLAAALYAVAVMPIQQAHFFTTDNFAVAFTTLALVASVRLGEEGRWRDAVWAGLFTGAAVACKINLAAFAVIIAVAVLQSQVLQLWSAWATEDSALIRPGWFKGALLLAVAGLVTFLSFRVFQPDAFTGPNIWDIWLEPRFLDNLRTVRGLVDGTVDMPPSHQWAARPPYVYALQNMIIWGMGIPLGVAAWAGFITMGYRLFRPGRSAGDLRARLKPLIPWIWVALYFAWQGRGFNPSLRYFLPIYPPLVLFAAAFSVELGKRMPMGVVGRLARASWLARRSIARGLLPALLLVATMSWAWAFTRIYTHPHTRIAAGNWMLQNAPRGSTLTDELWDDALPYTNGNDNDCNPFCLIETLPYAEDEPSKYLGSMQTAQDASGMPGKQQFVDGLLGQLARADYVVLSSARVYTSVARLPHRFPATLRYYTALFDGSLGFDLVADFHSFPSLFGLPIPDLGAEEQFTVYDHPRVLIFRRTERFNPDKARELLIGGMNWDEIYKLSALTTSSAPTALRLRDNNWDSLQRSDGRYLFDGQFLRGIVLSPPLHLALEAALWLLALETLGLATFGLLWRLRLPLPDRGILSARLIGLLLFALPPALLAASGRVGVSRSALGIWYGLLLGCGMRVLIMERRSIRAFVQANRGRILSAQILYAAAMALGLIVRTLNSGTAVPPAGFGIAQWTALLRSPVLPPPDPLFAGGQLVTPYAAILPVATLARLVGVSPALCFNLALAALFGLLVALVWAATTRPFAPQLPRRLHESRVVSPRELLPFLAAFMVVAPGLVVGSLTDQARVLLPLAWVKAGNLGALSVAVLAAGTLVVTRSFTSPLPEARGFPWLRRLTPLLLLAAALLALLRGQDRWAFTLVAIPAALLTWTGLADRRASYRGHRLLLVAALIAGALGLAGPFTVVSPGLSGATSAGLAPAALLPGLLIMLAGVAATCGLIAVQIVGRAIALGVGAAFAGWSLLGLVLNWPLWLLAVPAAIILAWLLTESLFRRPRLRRTAAVLSATLAGALLFTLADRMVAGQMAGDPAVEFGIGLVLMACGIGWSLPWIMRIVRPHRRGTALFLGGLLLGVLVVGTGETLRAGPVVQPAGDPPVSPALRGAIDTLVADAKGTPVVATAPLPRVPAVATETGLPVLLAAPQAEATLRDILRPSFDSVSAGRSRALGEIYGPQAGRAAAQIKSYAVDYILLGPDERALYGAQAGTGLRQLAANGTLQQIYTRQDVVLFRNPVRNSNPPFIAKPANLPIPPLKNGMLDRPLADLPVVDEYAWNRWASTDQLVAVLLWLVLFDLLGLLAWPLCARIFPRATDGGWSWGKLVGLLVWGYAIWLPVSLGWWSYRWPSLVIGAAVLGVLSWLAGGHPVRAQAWRSLVRVPAGWRAARRDLLCSEALFLIAFMGWTLLRAANPDLWHPTLGGEKPFEFGMLNAIVRSPVMPPPDPFFSGGALNYYYYGLFLVSVPIRATGIDPAIAFNLIVPVLFALLVTAAVTVVRALTGKWRWGLLGAVLVTLLGPPASAFTIGESRGLAVALRALRPGLAGWGGRLGDWFWGPSRIIPNTINEFPFFSYLFADLHAHMIALPVTILAVALAVEFGRTTSQRLSRSALGLAALVLGTLAAANSWDAPTYGLVIGGALVGRAWRTPLARSRPIRSLALGAGLAVVLLGGGLLLFLPFFTHYQAMVGGIGVVRRPDRLLDFAAIYGVSLYVSLTLLATLGWVVGQRATNPAWKLLGRGGAVALPLLTLTVLLVGAAFGRRVAAAPLGAPGSPPVPVLAFVLMVLVGFALLLALVARLHDEEWLILWIITAGLMVALGIQIVFVRDHLSGSDWERMNTVFKFGLQIWTLLALGAAAAFPLVLRLLRRLSDFAAVVWSTVFLGLLLAGTTYPVAAIPSRVSVRFQDHPGLTLDGLAYMQTARYEHDGKTIDLHWDAEAIGWLKQHLSGLPTVLQSEAEFYRAYGVRIAASTGLPTVLGRLHEDEQRPVDGVLAREADVQTIYSTPDPQTALDLLQKYHVDYVYVGQAERSYYDPAGLPKWDKMVGSTLDVAYKNPGVRIYRVRAVRVPPAAVAPVSPPSAEDPALQALEAEHQARPADGPTAVGLATAYLQAGRREEAAKVLEDAAPGNPRDVPLHHLLGDVEAQLGHADLAIAAWQAAVAANPSAGNIAKLGTGLVQLGRFDEAERVLRQAQQRDPKDPLIHFYLAEMAHKRKGPNDTELARQEYKTYLDQAPQDSPYRATAEQALKDLGR